MKEVSSFLFDGDRNWWEIIKEVNSCRANKNNLSLKTEKHTHAWRVKQTVTWPGPFSWPNGKKIFSDRKLICWQYFLWEISILSWNNLHINWANRWEYFLMRYYKPQKNELANIHSAYVQINLTKLVRDIKYLQNYKNLFRHSLLYSVRLTLGSHFVCMLDYKG